MDAGGVAAFFSIALEGGVKKALQKEALWVSTHMFECVAVSVALQVCSQFCADSLSQMSLRGRRARAWRSHCTRRCRYALFFALASTLLYFVTSHSRLRSSACSSLRSLLTA